MTAVYFEQFHTMQSDQPHDT